MLGIASLAKHESALKNGSGKKVVKFFLFLTDEKIAYLVLLFLSLILSGLLFYSFPASGI
jgi:hypothetical protein